MQNKCIGLFIGLIIFLCACVPMTVLEELAVIAARGVDITENNEIEATMNVIRFDPQADSIYTTVTGIGTTIKGAREDAGFRTGYDLVAGQINLEVFGKEAAEQGVFRYINGLIRDARVSDTMKLAVANTTAKELFKPETEQKEAIGQYLDNLIEVEIHENTFPTSTLQDFTRTSNTTGQDAVLPLFGFEQEKPSIVGIAVFQDDRYVQDITIQEGFLLSLFLDRVSNASENLKLPLKPFEEFSEKNTNEGEDMKKEEEFHLNLIIAKGKSKTKVENLKELKFTTDTYLEVDLVEVSLPLRIKEEKAARVLEKEIEKNLEQQFDALLKKVQEVNADPFGFGKIYRANKKDGKLTRDQWREKFPNIKVDFNVDVKLMHTGTIK